MRQEALVHVPETADIARVAGFADDLLDLREAVRGRQVGRVIVLLDRPEAAREGKLLFRRDVLAAKEDRPPLVERLADFEISLLAHGLGEVDAADLRPGMGG